MATWHFAFMRALPSRGGSKPARSQGAALPHSPLWKHRCSLPFKIALPSVHILGTADELYSFSELSELPRVSTNATVWLHEGGHVIPPLGHQLRSKLAAALQAATRSVSTVAGETASQQEHPGQAHVEHAGSLAASVGNWMGEEDDYVAEDGYGEDDALLPPITDTAEGKLFVDGVALDLEEIEGISLELPGIREAVAAWGYKVAWGRLLGAPASVAVSPKPIALSIITWQLRYRNQGSISTPTAGKVGVYRA